MVEDKLTAEQRIRLEAVNQANMRLGPMLGRGADEAVRDLLHQAARIEAYVDHGERPA